MIPNFWVFLCLNTVASSILLANATPLPLGVAVGDFTSPIINSVNKDTRANFPDALVPVSNLDTAFPDLKAPSHQMEAMVENLLPRGKDDSPSKKERISKKQSPEERAKAKALAKKRHSARTTNRRKEYEMGEVERVLNLSSGQRDKALKMGAALNMTEEEEKEEKRKQKEDATFARMAQNEAEWRRQQAEEQYRAQQMAYYDGNMQHNSGGSSSSNAWGVYGHNDAPPEHQQWGH
ncbi:hypothetical protein H0H93_015675 [Arthromyces matolae]|nr:hypothetical protein H0H93_015675 [Arthromyces matolae]